MVELSRIGQRVPECLPVFHVTAVVAYSRVENVRQRVPPEKQVAYDTHRTPVLLVRPQLPQVGNSVHPPLLLLQKSHKVSEVQVMLSQQFS